MHPNNRIVHGEKDVPISARPFQLGLISTKKSWFGFVKNDYMCGASLIAPNWTLTAGHCVTDDDGNIHAEFDIRAGSRDVESGYQSRTASKIDVKVHPSWTGEQSQGSIGKLYHFIPNLRWHCSVIF